MNELQRSTLELRRFLSLAETDTIELTSFGGRQRTQTAYARTVEEQLRLLELAERQPELKGSYTSFNLVHEGLHARIGEGRWVPGAQRTTDAEVVELRAVYVDFDAVRPRDISATDAEKARVHEVAANCKARLSSVFGTADCFGVGDSGNGYALFIALEPTPPTKASTERIQRFLKALATQFERPGVKIDPAVCNPARLCPAFGTMKRKGVNCPGRPHRMTTFYCPENVVRLPLEVL